MIFRDSINFILYKVYADIRAESARSYLGLLWWVIEPILYLCAYYILFVMIIKHGSPDFVPSFLCGMVVWKWFDSAVKGGGQSILANRELFSQVYVPKYIFPIISVIGSTVRFLPVFVILILFFMMYDILPQITWFALPILIIVQFSFVLAVAMLASALIPFLPDLRVAIDNGLLLLFFVSGIFFNINEVHEPLQTYLYLNPMAGLIDGYRSIMIRGEWPNFNYLAQIFLVTILVGTFAALLLKRLDRVYAKVRI